MATQTDDDRIERMFERLGALLQQRVVELEAGKPPAPLVARLWLKLAVVLRCSANMKGGLTKDSERAPFFTARGAAVTSDEVAVPSVALEDERAVERCDGECSPGERCAERAPNTADATVAEPASAVPKPPRS